MSLDSPVRPPLSPVDPVPSAAPEGVPVASGTADGLTVLAPDSTPTPRRRRARSLTELTSGATSGATGGTTGGMAGAAGAASEPPRAPAASVLAPTDQDSSARPEMGTPAAGAAPRPHDGLPDGEAVIEDDEAPADPSQRRAPLDLEPDALDLLFSGPPIVLRPQESASEPSRPRRARQPDRRRRSEATRAADPHALTVLSLVETFGVLPAKVAGALFTALTGLHEQTAHRMWKALEAAGVLRLRTAGDLGVTRAPWLQSLLLPGPGWADRPETGGRGGVVATAGETRPAVAAIGPGASAPQVIEAMMMGSEVVRRLALGWTIAENDAWLRGAAYLPRVGERADRTGRMREAERAGLLRFRPEGLAAHGRVVGLLPSAALIAAAEAERAGEAAAVRSAPTGPTVVGAPGGTAVRGRRRLISRAAGPLPTLLVGGGWTSLVRLTAILERVRIGAVPLELVCLRRREEVRWKLEAQLRHATGDETNRLRMLPRHAGTRWAAHWTDVAAAIARAITPDGRAAFGARLVTTIGRDPALATSEPPLFRGTEADDAA